jgi:hypothetical protein
LLPTHTSKSPLGEVHLINTAPFYRNRTGLYRTPKSTQVFANDFRTVRFDGLLRIKIPDRIPKWSGRVKIAVFCGEKEI